MDSQATRNVFVLASSLFLPSLSNKCFDVKGFRHPVAIWLGQDKQHADSSRENGQVRTYLHIIEESMLAREDQNSRAEPARVQ